MSYGYGRCMPCEAAAMNGLRGGLVGGGLGAIIMEPVRGLGDEHEAGGPGNMVGRAIANAFGPIAAWVAPATAIAGSAAYSAAVSALSAPKGAKGKTAATSALLVTGVAGVASAAMLAGAGAMMRSQEGVAALDMTTTGPAILYGTIGLAALGWGGYRAYKTFRRR